MYHLTFCIILCICCLDEYKSPPKIQLKRPNVNFTSIVLHVTAEKADQILPFIHNPSPSEKNKSPSAATDSGIGEIGGVKGAGCPRATSSPCMTPFLLLALKVTETPAAHKSTPTFHFNGGVGGRSHPKGVDARVHSGIVSSWSVQPAEQKTQLG